MFKSKSNEFKQRFYDQIQNDLYEQQRENMMLKKKN